VSRIFAEQRPVFRDDAGAGGNFSRDELRRFDIKGPALGVPLLFGATPVGALVVWSPGTGRQPAAQDWEELGRHAKLSITTVGRADSEQRRMQQIAALRGVLNRIPTGRQRAPLDEVLIEILRGIVDGGFDRARVLALKRPQPGEPRVARCEASYGGGKVNEFRGEKIDDSSPHLKAIIDQADRGNFEAGLRDPERGNRMFPFRHKFSLPENHPLAYAPLKVSGRLYGHITADNSRTARVITKDDLDHLMLAGIFAAQVIQNYPAQSGATGDAPKTAAAASPHGRGARAGRPATASSSRPARLLAADATAPARPRRKRR
jgi:hypothetical protein